jgi:site-specific DNA-methyltransferase (adenine-specific)
VAAGWRPHALQGGVDKMQKSIIVPDENAPVPSGWAADHVLPAVQKVTDVKMLWDGGTELNGEITKLKIKGRDVKELQQAKIYCEIRIGELLGPADHQAGPGRGNKTVGVPQPFSKYQVHELRRLAWFEKSPVKDIAIAAVQNGCNTRSGVIKEIETQCERMIGTDDGIVLEQLDIRHGRFQDTLADIPDGSVDLILTDPPYPKKFLPEWNDLADFASAKLKVGGSLVAYCGHAILPDVMNIFSDRLRFWWVMALVHKNGNKSLPGKFVMAGWKPIVWYVKERRCSNDYLPDVITGSPPRKSVGTIPEWSQGVDELKPIITALTSPDDLIVDPFAGSGTTGIAATQAGRRFIGAEVGDADSK